MGEGPLEHLPRTSLVLGITPPPTNRATSRNRVYGGGTVFTGGSTTLSFSFSPLLRWINPVEKENETDFYFQLARSNRGQLN